MISNVIHLLEFAFKREGNCNVMKSHYESYDGFNLIGTILYYNLSRGGLFINHPSPDLLNLLSQPSKLNF